jgi:hypothetical protein
MTLRYKLHSFWRRKTYLIRAAIWRLRLRAAYHLVGDRSFAANIEVIGSITILKGQSGPPLIRDVTVFKNKKWADWYHNGKEGPPPK